MQGQPIADVGIVGGGQLARMMAQAAISLGITVRILAERADDSAARVWRDVLVGSPDDPDALLALARGCRVVTFDHELAPQSALARLTATGCLLRPSAETLTFAQDKRWQRETLGRLGFPVPAFRMATSLEEVNAFAGDYGWPVVVKAPRGGYDGRGVWIVDDSAAAATPVSQLIAGGAAALVEQWLPIERELAIIIARRPAGETAVYPVVETVQVDGMCREVIAPASISRDVADEAERLARHIAETIGLTGVMAVELFLAGGRLVINELATRPHNSGHFSIEGCVTSQFEQHLRAVLDWPLGATKLTAPSAVMVNLIGAADGGDPLAALPRALDLEGVHVHLYGKAARPGRKLGHVTVLGNDAEETRARARRAAALLSAGVVTVEARG